MSFRKSLVDLPQEHRNPHDGNSSFEEFPVTSFSRMRISVAVNGTASCMESVLNVGLYFEKKGLL